jgi:lysyl-tRNA synthetase class 1
LSYDGATSITYECKETGNTETVDLSKTRIAKLAWKVDWPMRWLMENVVFEPGGHDHASPGSSYDVATVMAEKIFDIQEPLFAEYKFVGIQGGGSKMSGSKGNAISPAELLDIYEPALLLWLYTRRRPDQAFSLAFDTEIYRQYDEFDKEKGGNSIPFKQAVALGQIVQWSEEKVLELIKDLAVDYSEASVRARLPKARSWLEKYNLDEAVKLREEVNIEYVVTMDEVSKSQVKKLKEGLMESQSSIEELELLVYGIPKDPNLTDKENAPAQKVFFKHIYNLLINKDQGPRLSTFLWAIDRNKVLELLSI